jgi:hypothetical protein
MKTTKQLPAWVSKEPPAFLDDFPAGEGLSDRIVDRAFWLPYGDYELEQWLTALEAIDRHADPAPLLALLSKSAVPVRVQPFMEDLFNRMRWQPKDKRKTPLYDRTWAEAKLLMAKDRVRELVRAGTSVAEALEQVAKAEDIPFTTLENHYKGRRGSTRRMRRTRP